MSDIDFYLKQVNYKLKETPLFYIANDAERALGLEGLLENFFIVCMDDSDIYSNIHTKYGNIFSLENKTGELNAVFRSSAKLLDSELVKEFIERFFSISLCDFIETKTPHIGQTTFQTNNPGVDIQILFDIPTCYIHPVCKGMYFDSNLYALCPHIGIVRRAYKVICSNSKSK